MEWKYVYTKGIPIEAQYLYQKALELSGTERYESAFRYFRQAVVIAPRYANAIYQMGNCLEKLGQYYEALVLYERTLSIDPVNKDARIKIDLIRTNGTPGSTQANSRKRPPVYRMNNHPI